MKKSKASRLYMITAVIFSIIMAAAAYKQIKQCKDEAGYDGKKGVTRLAPAAPMTVPGESWKSNTIQINETVLTLPCKVIDLENAGLEVLGFEEGTAFYAGYGEDVYFADESGNKVCAEVINPNNGPELLKDCLIAAVYIWDWELVNENLTILFPGDIHIGSTEAEVIERYGKPDTREYTQSINMYSLEWNQRETGQYCLMDVEDGKVVSLFLAAFNTVEYTDYE